ncbi:MAG: MaoC/PaaZ C-terminal domain-containing protein [Burkholderiaceae bacterium]
MGYFFEQFAVGDTYLTPARTLTETDIGNFAGLTGDFNPVHTDEVFASATAFGGRIAHGPLMVGMAFGLLSRLNVIDGTVLALRRIEWTFDAPLRAGDTVHVDARVLAVRPSSRHPDRGTVEMSLSVVNQNGEAAQQGKASLIMMRGEPKP